MPRHPRRSGLGAVSATGALVILAGCLALACASQPAGPTGSVGGIAVDPSGHSLPGVTVTIQTPAGKAIDTVVTGPDGSFVFPSVPPGNYTVLTLLRGFTARTPLPATVVAGQSTQLPPLVLVPPDSPAQPPGEGQSPPIVLVTPTPGVR
jgi:Carboxypeptidase regulatory-like domain